MDLTGHRWCVGGLLGAVGTSHPLGRWLLALGRGRRRTSWRSSAVEPLMLWFGSRRGNGVPAGCQSVRLVLENAIYTKML